MPRTRVSRMISANRELPTYKLYYITYTILRVATLEKRLSEGKQVDLRLIQRI